MSKFQFVPVQCTQKALDKLEPENGHLYMTTDTKKIYLGANDKMLPMCEGTGLFYGTKEIEPDNSGVTPDPSVLFSLDEIEGADIPEVHDLILNVDGCFYKILSVDEDTRELSTTRLTLQGTGGGGGSGGGGGGSSSYALTYAAGSSKENIFAKDAEKMSIAFTSRQVGSDIDNTNHIIAITCTLSGENTPFLELYNIQVPFGTEKTIDLAPYKHLFNDISYKTVIVETTDYKNLEKKSLNYRIKLVDIALEYDAPVLLQASNKTFRYSCTVNGGDDLTNKRLIYTFYNEDNLTIPVVPAASVNMQNIIDLDLSSLSHGSYVVTVQGCGTVAGGATIFSNTLTHKIIYFDEAVGTPILSAFIPEKTEQLTNIPMSALVVTAGNVRDYNLEVYIDDLTMPATTLQITASSILTYNLYFETEGKHEVVLVIPELNVRFEATLDIKKYTGKLPVIDTDRADLELYLNPRGKSNDSLDRNVWSNFKNDFSATLNEKFYYGNINGWSLDEYGANYLKVSQGAAVALPNYRPYRSDAMGSGSQGLTIELDFKLNSVIDYQKSLISCVSRDLNGNIVAGFDITGDKAYLYTSIKNTITGNPVTLNMVEGQRIKLTYVIEKSDKDFPLILTYLNGIVSNVSTYTKDAEHFVDAGADGSTPGTLVINSQYGEIDFYGIRIYASALDQATVLGNYQASLNTLAEREASFNSNSILTKNKVDLRYMEAEDYPLGIPYIKLTGGYKASDKKAMTMGTSGDVFALPVGKKDYRLISFELKYPKTGYFAEKKYDDFKELCTFASGKTVSNKNPAYGETPITGAVMYAQGTSSLEYPVKNLRVQFKTNKIAVRPGMEPVNLICLKADFMESSGSHNTGAANFIDDVYYMAGMETPGQQYYDKEDIVTCIKGHPVAVFWSESGDDDDYTYIGKYNLNLDKATPEPFGFKNVPEEYDANAPVKFGWDEQGNNTIRCFEFLDNSVLVCNFLAKEGKTYEETWYELITDPTTKKTHYGWTEGFESRHPEDIVDEHGADCLYPMASWVHELYTLRQTDEAKALARFKNEYECYFNKDYLIGYYLITNVLQMTDSRAKNCMMASWGPEPDGFLGDSQFKAKGYYPLIQNENGEWVEDKTQPEIKPNNYIWYPIFYDMDTMLGIDNQGYPRLKYYEEDTNTELFNDKDTLWPLVRDALASEIVEYYDKFETSGKMFTAPTILTYFNTNQANLANEALYNGDAEYKYIDTFRKGYFDHLNTNEKGEPTWIAPGKSTRLYAAQGNRSLDRQYFVTNRINFLRGKYQSPNYQSGDRVEFRCYNPDGKAEISQEEQEKVQLSKIAVPFSVQFNLEALGPGFAGVRIGQNGTIHNHYFTMNNYEAAIAPQQDPDDTESYILGLNNLKDIGDLSNKYLGGFEIKSTNKLNRIILGNDHVNYYNPYWSKKQSLVDVQACYLLEEFNMYNCSGYRQALSFANCKQLKRLYLTGSGVNALTLPEGTVLEEVRLPDTLGTLTIKNQSFLHKDKFSMGYYDYGTDEHINPLNPKFVNTYNNLQYLEILNTDIDTYDMVIKAPNLQEYYLTNVEWEIEADDAQYCSVRESDFISGAQYYKYNNSLYVPYIATSFESGLYEKISLINSDNTITRIPVLEKLIRLRTRHNTPQANALTGTVHINVLCADGSKPVVNEFAIYQKYHAIYPNLNIIYGEKINLNAAPEIKFYRTDIDNMNNDVVADYVVKTNGTYTLEQLTGPNSPAGEELFVPVKVSTNTFTYEFTGEWVNCDNKSDIYNADRFKSFKPTANLRLAPKFTAHARKYIIEFKGLNKNTLFTVEREYGEMLNKDALDPRAYYLYKDDSAFEHDRYVLKGWCSQKDYDDGIKNPALYDLTAPVLKSDRYYPYFELEDAREVASSDVLFNVDGNTINLNPEYRDLVQGKLTIPAKSGVTIIGNFAHTQLTAVYCPSEQYTTIYNGFGDLGVFERGGSTLLEFVYLPNSIMTIGPNVFAQCKKLRITELPTSLQFLGSRAFYDCGNGVKITSLPESLTAIEFNAFTNCPNVNIDTLGSAIPGQGLQSIGSQAFFGTGSTVMHLTINASITTLADNSFDNSYIHVQDIYNYTQLDVSKCGLPTNANYHTMTGGA